MRPSFWPLLFAGFFLAACGSDGQESLGVVNFSCSQTTVACNSMAAVGALNAVVIITKETCVPSLWNDGKYVAGAPTTLAVAQCNGGSCQGSASKWFAPGNLNEPISSVPKTNYNTCVIVDSNADSNIGGPADFLATPN